MSEEESRHVFQNGRAIFMRNWPYAWRLAQQPGSPVRGQVQISPIPSWSKGQPGRGTLGGFMLGIHKHTPYPKAARQWVRFLTSQEAQILIWEKLGLVPARQTAFAHLHNEEGIDLNVLMDIMENTVPRPVNPLYIPLSQSVQAYLSGALSEVYTIEDSLDRMDTDLERISMILEYENRS